MSTEPPPKIKLAHDDNLAIYTKGDTTLVLCTSSFVLTPASAAVKTPRLVIYADTIFIGGQIECRGKELQLHCNRLEWAGTNESTFLNFKGVDGIQVAAVGPQAGATNGQSGGIVVIHVHCLPLVVEGNKLTFWPVPFKADVSGGAAGKYHRDASSKDWVNGKAGEPGKVTLLYSNPIYRGAVAVLDAYSLQDSLPRRLRAIQVEIVSALEPNCGIIDSLRQNVLQLKELCSALIELHGTLCRCLDLVKTQGLSSAAGNTKTDLEGIAEFIKSLFSLQDYSLAYPDIRQPAQDLALVLGTPAQADSAEKLSATIQALNWCKLSVESKIAEQKGKRYPSTPLYTLVDTIWNTVSKAHELAVGDFKGRVKPSQVANADVVSYSKSGTDDMAMDIPLVHPDQCQMMLRYFDAAFFSNDVLTARDGYQMLLERLRFVPKLLAQAELVATKGGAKDKKPWPLQLAFQDMESARGLALWTTDTLANAYNHVCGRLDQLAMNLDLFGLSADSAPRLSYDYHSQDAKHQMERLSRFEVSFWKFFDAYQDQMDAGWSLQESRAVNIYRRKQTDDEMTRAMATLKEKEKQIEKAADEIATKRDKLRDALHAVKRDLDRWQWPGIGSTIAAVGSMVIVGAFLASNPVGWFTAAVAVAVGAQQVGSLKDEMFDTIKDANGQSINKKYLINELGSCEDDIASLLKTAYTMKNDGTRSVDESDTQKIAVTEVQLRNFLKQFKDKLPDGRGENLKGLLDDFVAATTARNQNILTYNNAVIRLYQEIKNKALIQKQTDHLGSELLKQNQGLPSIVGYYQRLRRDSRVSILRAIKQSALALRFWGLRATTQFSAPSLLSDVDELQAHLGVLTQEYELSISRFGSFSQSIWPRVVSDTGILYRLSDHERDGLKTGVVHDNDTGHKVYSVQIVGLGAAVTRDTAVAQSPFAGHSNVRISQVRAWLPGAVILDEDGDNKDASTDTTTAGRKQLNVDLVHEGKEIITDPDDISFTFEHAPIHLSFQYDWRRVKSRADIKQEAATARQVLPSDWSSGNANARVQAAFGPFATWRLTLRGAVNGRLDLEGVRDVYLEFCGSSFPFRG